MAVRNAFCEDSRGDCEWSVRWRVGGVNRRPTEAVGLSPAYPPQASLHSACGVTHNRRPAEAFRVVIVLVGKWQGNSYVYSAERPARARLGGCRWAGVCARSAVCEPRLIMGTSLRLSAGACMRERSLKSLRTLRSLGLLESLGLLGTLIFLEIVWVGAIEG